MQASETKMFEQFSRGKVPATIAFMLHWLVAVPGTLIIGAFPDSWFRSLFVYTPSYAVMGADAVMPFSAVIGAVLGYCSKPPDP